MPKEHPPIYRHVLKQAWKITINNKRLWVLGFFATFLANAGIYDILLRGISGAVNRGALSSVFLQTDFLQTSSLAFGALSIPFTLWEIGEKISIVLPVLIFISVICALFLWLGASSQGGLMFAASKAVKNSKYDLKDAFHSGTVNFWPLLITNLVSKTIASLLLLGVSYPVFLILTSEGIKPMLLYFALFFLFVPGALIVSFLGLFSGAGVVTKKMNLFVAVKTSWEQFSKHWLVSLEMAFIILGLGVLVTAGMLLAVLILSVPFVILAVIAGLFAGGAGTSFVFLVAFAALFALALAIGSAFTTFQISAWTLLYLRFLEKGAVAKVVRLWNSLPKYLTPKRR